MATLTGAGRSHFVHYEDSAGVPWPQQRGDGRWPSASLHSFFPTGFRRQQQHDTSSQEQPRFSCVKNVDYFEIITLYTLCGNQRGEEYDGGVYDLIGKLIRSENVYIHA